MDVRFSIPFEKMHGSGNDFIVIRQSDLPIADTDLPEFVRAVCRRGMSIGADGVIVIGKSSDADFSWHYINADGSDGDMCGNGAMVGARFAVAHQIAAQKHSFSTSSGIVHARVDEDRISLQMMDAIAGEQGMKFDPLPNVEFDRFMFGVPHVVGFADDADAIENLDDLGRSIRNDPQLQPEGANVNLIHKLDEHSIRMRTYERGVEAETLACGTGAVCSAIAANRRGMVQQPVRVRVSSGLDLNVEWSDDGERATDIQLTGTARTVATGVITPEALL